MNAAEVELLLKLCIMTVNSYGCPGCKCDTVIDVADAGETETLFQAALPTTRYDTIVELKTEVLPVNQDKVSPVAPTLLKVRFVGMSGAATKARHHSTKQTR